MPKAGIHACRSTNWKSAELALKRAQSRSASANTRHATISATPRIVRSFCSLSRRQSSRSDPRSGSAISDDRIGKDIKALVPQVVSEHHHHADEERCRISAHGAGLQPAEHFAHAAHRARDAIHGPVDGAGVDQLPEATL